MNPSPTPPVLTGGDTLVIKTFLNSPDEVAAYIVSMLDQHFAAGRVLRGSADAASRSLLVHQDAPLYADGEPEATAPGSRYAQVGTAEGTAKLYAVVKWAFETLITDEQIDVYKADAVDRAVVLLANSLSRKANEIAWQAIVDEVTTDFAGTVTAWDSATTAQHILRPIAQAKAALANLGRGYNPDVLLVTESAAALLASDDKVAALLARENGTAPIYSGSIGVILDLEVVPVLDSELPASRAEDALVVDSARVGGLADAKPQTAKSIRKEEIDAWLLQAKREFVPYISDTRAGIWVPGIGA